MARWIGPALAASLFLPAVSLADHCCRNLTCADLPAFECVAQGGAVGYCFDGLPCGAGSCSVGTLGVISDLRAVKRPAAGGADVVFAWSADPAADRYDLRYAISKDRVPACDGCAGASPVAGSAPAFVPAAVHRAAVDGPAGTAFFYDVRPGCGEDRIGACCVPSLCFHVRDRTDCGFNGGIYAGDTTRCNEISCPVTLGSCCNPEGSCSLQISEVACGHHAGRWEAAPTCSGCFALPASGACCLPSGCSEAMEPSACAGGGGTFLGAFTTCAGNPCALGSCCLPDSSCTANETAASCAAAGGTYTPATGCYIAPCLGQPGACCTGVGCNDGVIHRDCDFVGTWQGPGSACASVVCPSACCRAGNCSLRRPAACAAVGGSYQGDGIGCSPSVCAAGACCLASSCDDTATSAECASRGGAYAGAGSTCAAGACGTGACCIGSGCDERLASSCAAASGIFRGNGTTCASVSSCQGACCWFLGCEDGLTPDDCSLLGNGRHQGDGTVCAADSCPGACCLRHGCAVLPIETCIAGGGSRPFGLDAPDCVQGPCTIFNRGKCCGLFGCLVATGDECMRRGGTWDFSQTSCIQPCAVGTGACCEGTACSGQTALLCQLRGGQFLGYGTTCDSNGQCVGSTVCSCASTPCATGACCGIATGCEILDEFECCVRGGVLEVGSSCSPACDPAPCCLGGQCVLLAPGVCAAEGGAANGCALGGGC